MILRVEPLTAEAFAPFGEVIEADARFLSFPVNAGTSQRFHDLARLDPGPDGRLIVSIFRAQPRPLPFTLALLERHPLASQAFVPLNGTPFLVVVAPRGESIAPESVRAFLAGSARSARLPRLPDRTRRAGKPLVALVAFRTDQRAQRH